MQRTRTGRLYLLFLFPYKQQMVCHTKQLRLFTNVKMITKVLCIVLVTHFVDSILYQLAGSIGRNLMQYCNPAVDKQLSCSIHCVEYKGKIVEFECILVIITPGKVVSIVFQFGKKQKIIGYKSKKYLTAVFTDTFCFADTPFLISIVFQVIKRSEQQHYVKRFVCITRKVKRIALNKVNLIFRC